MEELRILEEKIDKVISHLNSLKERVKALEEENARLKEVKREVADKIGSMIDRLTNLEGT
ncbi:MAG TPA: hypothetical protein EYP24_05940 [bacterium (Candidatus Stahlbacteria)]|nr:hypothetical protein [Candidatus Stahlbacteria bacterium]